MFIGIVFVIVLVVLACWEMFSWWRIYRRLKLHGRLVQAHVTAIERQARLVSHIGGLTGAVQRIKYEDFLSAQWKDPVTQQTYLFRARVSDYDHFHVGEPLMIMMNPEKPAEYRLYSARYKRSAKKPLLRSETASFQDYERGYQPSTPGMQAQNDEEEYEKPKASYPQQLPEQENH